MHEPTAAPNFPRIQQTVANSLVSRLALKTDTIYTTQLLFFMTFAQIRLNVQKNLSNAMHIK